MSSTGPTFKPYDADAIALRALRAARAELVADLAGIDQRISEIEARQSEQTGAVVGSPPQAANPSVSANAFHSMSIVDAAVAQLHQSGKELVTRDIAAALVAGGMPIKHSDPAHAVHNLLSKRSKTVGDVIFAGRGKWGLKAWYSKPELDGIAAIRGGMPGRDAELHKKKVREAIDAAKARGVKFGRKTFDELYTVEQIAEFQKLRASGVSITAALAHIQMPMATYRKYKERMDGKSAEPKQEGLSAEAEPSKVVPIRRKKGA